MKKILLPIIFLIVFSCEEQVKINLSEENHTKFERSAMLSSCGFITFPLDKETGFRHRSMSIDSFDGNDYLSFINTLNNSIYIYEINAPNNLKKIELSKQGPDGVGGLSIASHKLLSSDSIMLFNAMSANLFILDSKGQVIFKESLLDYKTIKREPNPEPSTLSPIIFKNNTVFMSGSFDSYLTDYSSSMTTISYNLETKELDFIIPLSEIYNSGYWGEQFKYNPSLTYSQKLDKLLVNYPIDPKISIVDFDGNKTDDFYEVNSLINEIKPLREDIEYGLEKDHSIRDPEQYEYSLTNSDFRTIISDNYNDLFYRIAYIRPSTEEFKLGQKMTNSAISIINSDFKKIGEKFFDSSKYDPSSILVCKEGILIARSDLYKTDEDNLTFELFKIIYK
ncbi:MAG: hypothetical protein VYB44_16370 [Bacteroidota bacterium]|nr:hypothetical protein [Bacteroidota bacterium]